MGFEAKKLKQTEKAKEILDYLKKSKLIKGKINEVVYASTLRKEKSYEESVCLYRMVLNEEPKNKYAIIGLAAALKDLGEYDEAYILCTSVLNLYPNSKIEALNVLKSILVRNNNIKLAKNIINQLEKYYYKFNPFRFIDELIEKYKKKNDLDGVKRISTIRKALEASI